MIERSKTRIPFDGAEKRTCPDCKRRWPWFQLKEAPVDLILRSGGLPVVGPTPTLQEILYATGGRESLFVNDFGGDSTQTEFAVNTAAGTHDSSDLTRDTVYMADGPNPVGSQAGSGHMEVLYTTDPATFTGTISFIRWHLRSWWENYGATRTVQTSGIWTVAGFGATNTVGTHSLAGIESPPTSLASFNIDVPLNPTTGLPWTAAQFNARKAGFQLDNFTLDGNAVPFAETYTHCAEFWIEIWGIS